MSVCSFSSLSSAEAGDPPRSSKRVELVDKYDTGRHCTRLREEIANARSADADEHFDKFRAVDGEEGHAGLAGDGACEQRLSRAGRPD